MILVIFTLGLKVKFATSWCFPEYAHIITYRLSFGVLVICYGLLLNVVREQTLKYTNWIVSWNYFFMKLLSCNIFVNFNCKEKWVLLYLFLKLKVSDVINLKLQQYSLKQLLYPIRIAENFRDCSRNNIQISAIYTQTAPKLAGVGVSPRSRSKLVWMDGVN